MKEIEFPLFPGVRETFAVVEFDNESVKVVHHSWLCDKDTKHRWHPKGAIKSLNKAISEGLAPAANWKFHPIHVYLGGVCSGWDYTLLHSKILVSGLGVEEKTQVSLPSRRSCEVPQQNHSKGLVPAANWEFHPIGVHTNHQ